MNDIEKKILAVRLFRLSDELEEVAAYLSPFGPRALLEVDRFHTKMRDCVEMIGSDPAYAKEYSRGHDLIVVIEDAWLAMCENFFTEHTIEVIREALDGAEEYVETLLNKVFEGGSDAFTEEWVNAIDDVKLDDLRLEADRLLVERIDAKGYAALRR